MHPTGPTHRPAALPAPLTAPLAALAIAVMSATVARAGGPPPDQAVPQRAPAATEMNAPAEATAAEAAPPARSSAFSTPTDRNELRQRPLPARFPLPSLRSTPSDGTVDVRLINYTDANVSFEVIGATGSRLLAGTLEQPERSLTTLDGLQLPVDIVVNRPDGRFVLVRPFLNDDGGIDLILDYATDLNSDVNYVNINPLGTVYLY